MAWFNYLFALSLYLAGACHPSEPPNGQDSLSCPTSGISCAQVLCDASDFLEIPDMARNRENGIWASKAPSQLLVLLDLCVQMSFYKSLSTSHYASSYSHEGEPGVSPDSADLELPAILIAYQDNGYRSINEEYYGAATNYDAYKSYETERPLKSGCYMTTDHMPMARDMSESSVSIKSSLSSVKVKFDKLLKIRRVSPVLMVSFMEIPPFISSTAGTISPVVFSFTPLQALEVASTLSIDITSVFTLPGDSSGYACMIGTTSATCSYDGTSKLLTITAGFTAGSTSDTKITIQDTPTIARPQGLQYPSTPGLYEIPISLRYSASYTYTGIQPILVMPTTAPTTASISLAHLSYSTASGIPNLATITLKPSSSINFNPNDTISIYFPLKTSDGSNGLSSTLGLCRKYTYVNSSVRCSQNYDINTNDEIPCMDKTNPSLIINCRIVIGSSKSYTPTTIIAQIVSGTTDELKLSFTIFSPMSPSIPLSVIMTLGATYQGESTSKALNLFSSMQSGKSFFYKKDVSGSDFTYKLSTYYESDFTTAKILIYTGPNMHRVPNNTPLHDDIYPDLNILFTSSFETIPVSGDTFYQISFTQNKIPGMLDDSTNTYYLYIKSDDTLGTYGTLSPNMLNKLSTTVTDSTTLYDKTNIVLGTTSWVTFSIKPNLVTDINTKIELVFRSVSLLWNKCYFIDSSGNEDNSICSVNTYSGKITISNLLPSFILLLGALFDLDLGDF